MAVDCADVSVRGTVLQVCASGCRQPISPPWVGQGLPRTNREVPSTASVAPEGPGSGVRLALPTPVAGPRGPPVGAGSAALWISGCARGQFPSASAGHGVQASYAAADGHSDPRGKRTKHRQQQAHIWGTFPAPASRFIPVRCWIRPVGLLSGGRRHSRPLTER